MNQPAFAKDAESAARLSDALVPIQNKLRTCIQCGTCSASCPNEFAMDHTPRQLWRMVLMNRPEAVFSSRTFELCSACYTCSLRCPRGLPLTEAMAALKQVAARERLAPVRKSRRFYGSFLNSVRRHGRVREMEFMTLYFWAMKNPLLPLSFASLGTRLMAKGKVSVQIPSGGARKGSLAAIFDKTEELEAQE